MVDNQTRAVGRRCAAIDTLKAITRENPESLRRTGEAVLPSDRTTSRTRREAGCDDRIADGAKSIHIGLIARRDIFARQFCEISFAGCSTEVMRNLPQDIEQQLGGIIAPPLFASYARSATTHCNPPRNNKPPGRNTVSPGRPVRAGRPPLNCSWSIAPLSPRIGLESPRPRATDARRRDKSFSAAAAAPATSPRA